MLECKWHIALLTTGGTIEKSYDESDGSLANRETFVGQIVRESLRLPSTVIDVIPILSKDSLEMTNVDRDTIYKTILKEQSHRPVIILHGTDTMSITAEWVAKKIPHPQHPVIFTGAMRPMGFLQSDGLQNLTEALVLAKTLQPGCYISFHSQVFKAGQAKKNHHLGTFEQTQHT
ncbi:MAG: asparaginase domain-containing protein [Oligoflexales bacterium]